MLEKFNKILVLAPHTDDGELGAGGLIHKAISLSCDVDYVAFSAAEESVPEGFPTSILRTEVLNATRVLGIDGDNVSVLNYKVRNFPSCRQEILDDLISLRKKKKYDLVLTPMTTDIHQDHCTITQEAIRAFKQTTVFGYELIWNNLSQSSTCFIKVSKSDIDAKVNAMAQYTSQAGRDYTSEKFIFSLAHTRGVQIGSEYAECFEVIRLVL